MTFDESADTSVLVYSLTESKRYVNSPVLFYNPNATEKEDDSSVLVYTPNASEEASSLIVAYTPSSQKDSSHWQFLVDFLATKKVGERLSVNGAAICKKAFSIILGCSSTRIDRMVSVGQKGQVRLVHGNSGSVQSSEKTADAKAWIKVFF